MAVRQQRVLARNYQSGIEVVQARTRTAHNRGTGSARCPIAPPIQTAPQGESASLANLQWRWRRSLLVSCFWLGCLGLGPFLRVLHMSRSRVRYRLDSEDSTS